MSAIHERPPSLWESCGPVGGIYARDQRSGGRLMAIKRHDVSVSRGGRRVNTKINAPTDIGLTTGFVRQSSPMSERDWTNLSMAERRDLARRILIAENKPLSKNAINKLARYGHGLK